MDNFSAFHSTARVCINGVRLGVGVVRFERQGNDIIHGQSRELAWTDVHKDEPAGVQGPLCRT
jgi:hypothetical protein